MPGPTRLLARPAREVIPSVCTQIEPAAPSNLAQALAMVRASLGYLPPVTRLSWGRPLRRRR